VLKIYGQARPEGEGFSEPDIKIPGALGNGLVGFFGLLYWLLIKFHNCYETLYFI
jgi:hypothetical protein